MDREQLQEHAVELLTKEKRLICQWSTGVGKSGVVLRFLRDNPWMTCLILVPEQNNIENWETEFSKFGIPMENVRVVCYASLHKYKNTSWDLLVFDEAPHMDTIKRRHICESVDGSYVLALGAVIDEEETSALEHTYGHFVKSYVTMRRAIEWGILPSPTINICHMSMDNTDRCFKYKGRNLTAKEMYDVLQSKVESAVVNYNANQNAFMKNNMLRAGNERKRFLGKLKENAIGLIAANLMSKDIRFLCFCSSIDQAEKLGGSHAFTSKTPASMKLLDKFNNHEIDSLFVVGKLIEGQNLVDIQHGILGQLGGTSRITVQSIGRVMRSKNPVIWVPTFDGTKDDSFLYTLTSNIPEDYIKHYNF